MARFGLYNGGDFVRQCPADYRDEIFGNIVSRVVEYGALGGSVRVDPYAAAWEDHIVSRNDFPGLRLDLQMMSTATPGQIQWSQGSAANASDTQQTMKYANWQVQFGPRSANQRVRRTQQTVTAADMRTKKGAIAAVYMALSAEFTAAEFTQAMRASFDYNMANNANGAYAILNPTGPYNPPIENAGSDYFILTVACGTGRKQCRNQIFRVKLPESIRDMNHAYAVALNGFQRVCPFCQEALVFVNGNGEKADQDDSYLKKHENVSGVALRDLYNYLLDVDNRRIVKRT